MCPFPCAVAPSAPPPFFLRCPSPAVSGPRRPRTEVLPADLTEVVPTPYSCRRALVADLSLKEGEKIHVSLGRQHHTHPHGLMSRHRVPAVAVPLPGQPSAAPSAMAPGEVGGGGTQGRLGGGSSSEGGGAVDGWATF